MLNLLGVFIGGGIGSVLRFGICRIISSHWGTFTVNVVGAFLIGVAYTYFQKHTIFSSDIKTFIMAGLLGGFTTFSTYILNFVTMVEQNHLTEGLLYLIGSIVIGALFLILGIKVG